MSEPQKSETIPHPPFSFRMADLAARFRVCTKTIGRHVEQGLLPKPDFYVGRSPHWIPTTIDVWIATKKCV
jgi:hypothetical protein